MALNIREIAKIAGVAPSTISRATNPKTRHLLSEKTLKKIDALVKEHAYVPNIAARQLNKPGTKTIGVLLPYYERMFYHSYYIHVLAGIADALRDTEYFFKLILLKPKKKKWNWYDFQAGEGVEGIIVTHWQSFFSSRFLAEKKHRLPHVVINDFDPKMNAFFVCEDSAMGGRLAAEHLYQKGHRTVGVITGTAGSRDSQHRLRGFLDFFANQNTPIPAYQVVEGDFGGGDKTIKAIDTLLGLKERPTAIFTCNDKIALTTLQHISENGISCPKDISIVGYDDVEESAVSSPPLTTVRQPLYEIAVSAVNTMVRHLSNSEKTARLTGSRHLPVTLVPRQSVKEI